MMQRFQLILVPKCTELSISKGKMIEFNLLGKGDQPSFDTLKALVESIPCAQKDKKGSVMSPFEQDCYWIVRSDEGVIQIEINAGLKQPPENAASRISIRTSPPFPSEKLLEEIRQIVETLLKKYGFKIFCLGTLGFISSEDILKEGLRRTIKGDY